MRCAWQAYLRMLPQWMRLQVDKLGRESLQELRLRCGQPPNLILDNGMQFLQRVTAAEDLQHIINCATQYSPWTSQTIAKGYISVAGGHRIGVCGECVVHDGVINGIRNISSLCLRVARDFEGIAARAKECRGNVLIIGRPGSGKTTLLRDLIRQKSISSCIGVVDERGELFPPEGGGACFALNTAIDVLSFCPKPQGIDMLLRTMGPACIAVDEITNEADSNALLRAGWCGVGLLATAHASNRHELENRPIYRDFLDRKLFDTLIIMQPDKSWRAERMS